MKRRARKPTTEIIELIQKNLVVKQATAASIIFALAFTVLSGGEALEQADPQNYLFNTGQTVQPYFEGWSHNSDGSFEMHFGISIETTLIQCMCRLGLTIGSILIQSTRANRRFSILASTAGCLV